CCKVSQHRAIASYIGIPVMIRFNVVFKLIMINNYTKEKAKIYNLHVYKSLNQSSPAVSSVCAVSSQGCLSCVSILMPKKHGYCRPVANPCNAPNQYSLAQPCVALSNPNDAPAFCAQFFSPDNSPLDP